MENMKPDEGLAQSAKHEGSSIKRWFVVARDYSDTDPVNKHWVKSPEKVAKISASRRGGPSRELLVLQLGWPHGHRAEQDGPIPPGTQFDVFPLDESSTISDVLKAEKISVRGKWWVDESACRQRAGAGSKTANGCYRDGLGRSRAPISSLPVLRGAGRDRDPERAERRSARHCPSAPESPVDCLASGWEQRRGAPVGGRMGLARTRWKEGR